MDIVVDHIPPRFDMLLSRSWSRKLGGTMQMDTSFATIPIFGGEFRIVYQENQLAYIISDHEKPTNHPIYEEEQDLGSCILHLATDQSKSIIAIRKMKEQ